MGSSESLFFLLLMTLMIGMPIVGWFISQKYDSKNASIWFLSLIFDSLQIPLIAFKSTYPSWFTIVFPGSIPTLFYVTILMVLRSEYKNEHVVWRLQLPVVAFYIIFSSFLYLLFSDIPQAIRIQSIINNIFFLLFAVVVWWLSLKVALLKKSRSMTFISVGFFISIFGYSFNAFSQIFLGETTQLFVFSNAGNFLIWTLCINLILMTFGYLGYSLENAESEKKLFASEASLSNERRQFSERESEELRKVVADLDHMVMVNSRFMNLNALAVFNSAIVHEISQPLHAASICLNALKLNSENQDGNFTNDINSAIRLINEASSIILVLRQMMKYGNDMLEKVDLNDALKTLFPIIQSEAKRRNVVLTENISDIRLESSCNRVMFQRLILNLIANAFDSFESNHTINPTLHISCEFYKSTYELNKSHAVIKISDNGSGLSEEQLELLFKPFATSKLDGLGVGLSLAQILLNKWNGSIEANINDNASGLTFTVRIPILLA